MQIVACHVDYGNRPESGAEADFVEQWCRRYDIVFRKRTIEEVNYARVYCFKLAQCYGWLGRRNTYAIQLVPHFDKMSSLRTRNM